MKKEKRIFSLLELTPETVKLLDEFIAKKGWSGKIQKMELYTIRQIPETYPERMRLSLNEFGSYLKDKKFPTEGWLRARFILRKEDGDIWTIRIWLHTPKWEMSGARRHWSKE
ncbi:MAG: hypothetical protein QUS07_07150 [Methanothrix sp.]|nr:hypothetical protein [Methanothrix sp.]